MNSTTLAGVKIGAGHPVRIMGVINASPESFFKGSVAKGKRTLRDTAKRMEQQGADFIDVGAMSSAPYLKTHITEIEEIRRLTAAIQTIATAVRIPLSVDSFRSAPALAGMNAGAKILNDITGLLGDPGMAAVARKAQGVILMAHPIAGKGPLVRLLQNSIRAARRAGIPLSRIVVDPGIGFFRDTGMPWWEWDLAVLRDLGHLKRLGVPLLVGVSRKSFIGKITGVKGGPEDRLAGSLSATAVAVLNGAAIIRTHDVKETLEAVRIAEKLREEG